MSLTIEWKSRVDAWREELKNHFYRPLGTVEWRGFVTKEQLSVAEAARHEAKPVAGGTTWGGKWEYGWFFGDFALPAEALGKRIVLKEDVGGEAVVFVNGRAAGAGDHFHKEVNLSYSGVPGHRYQIAIESYAGHGAHVWKVGPTPPGRVTVPEPPAAQVTVRESTFGVWEEDAYQLWLDVETLYQLRNALDPNALRVQEIDQALREFTVVVDFEQPYEERMASIRAGRERLQALLQCVNGSTAPTLYCFGHAHIDVAWLWPLAETERKCARTFSSQLHLMTEYPEYRFVQSQPHLYGMTKRLYPEVYQRIKEAIKAGQWVPEGGMWVEADTNLSGGESLIRQFLHGKRFFREEFGIENEMLWLPDVFGYSGALPQIMRGCGCKYFSTAKIFWAYNGGDPFPYNTFTWEGIDGSEVLVHLCNDYNSETDAKAVVARWNDRVQKDGFSTRLVPFGWGDGGGGPTRDHLEYLRRLKDLEGAPKTRIASPIAYFKEQEAKGWPKERYVGELYFQAHRGTYTTQARTKRGNRKSELALRDAELWGAAAKALKGYPYPLPKMDATWKKVLLNQFHDIIPGSSIHRVYEEAEAAYGEVVNTAKEVAGEATSALADQSRALTAFNSLSWERSALVALPRGFVGATDLSGKPLPIQEHEGLTFAEVTVPSCGWTTVLPSDLCESARPVSSTVHASECVIENEFLRLAFNGKGEITSIYDKEVGKELAAGLCNSFKMYKDIPVTFEAWDIDSTYTCTPVELAADACLEVQASGPLFARVRITRMLNQSSMTQEVTLRRGSRRVEFRTKIAWTEQHKLLKVAFPVAVHANEAIHDIQFGHIRRPNHASRPFDADRYEVSQHKWTALAEENRGFAVLNDCKYGVNVAGNSINLTLLRAPMGPDMTADQGLQEFAYAIYPWNGSFAEADVVREAYMLNCPVITASGAAGEKSLLALDAANIVVDTVKPAEDGSADVVVRLYESKRMATRCILTTALPASAIAQTDMLERTQKELPMTGGKITLEFRPFEVKTVRLRA